MIRRPPRSTLSSSSAASDVYKRQLLYCRPYYLLFQTALYLGVNEFSTKALIGDTSPTGDGTATEPREGLAICRAKTAPSVLVQSREFNPRLTALQSSAPLTELIQPQFNFSYFLENPALMSQCL